MTPESVINEVVNGRAKPGWAIFRYNYKFALSRIAGRTLFLILSSVMAAIFFYSWLADSKSVYLIYLFISAIPSLISFLMLGAVVLELFQSKKNMIVLTDTEVIKCFKGKYESYAYDMVINLRITNPYSADTPAIAKRKKQYVDFTNKLNNRQVELTRDRIFGSPETLYNLLKNRTI